MTIETLQERIEKAEQKIEKKQNTIIKKENLISRKTSESEIRYLRDDIKRLNKEIQATKATLEKYRKQLAGEIEKESIFLNEIPEIMKQMERDLIQKWDEHDMKRKEFLKSRYDVLGYKEFMKTYKYSDYEFMGTSNNDLHKRNAKDARILVLDFYNRVKAITGEITDWSGIHCSNGSHGTVVLNGLVIGKEGRASVESILAGGYNIQRLHIRVLVKEI